MSIYTITYHDSPSCRGILWGRFYSKSEAKEYLRSRNFTIKGISTSVIAIATAYHNPYNQSYCWLYTNL